MIRYVIKRLLLLIPVVLCVAILIFTIMYFCPGDPAPLILGPGATQADLEAKREELGLYDPYHTRLLEYLEDVFLHFDFGQSYMNNSSVTSDILIRFPKTLIVSMVSILIALLVGIPLGINAALHQGKLWDTVSMLIAMVGVSMPVFWLALMLSLIFALWLGLLPPLGFESWENYILPCAANALNGIAMIARQMRSSMLETIHSDYIITARAKGMSKSRITWGHAVPNALIPVITVAGSTFGRLLGGTIVTETIFSIPGIGTYIITAINYRDYPAIQGSVIFTAIVFGIVMVLVDLVYAAIDPRIKAQYARRKRRG